MTEGTQQLAASVEKAAEGALKAGLGLHDAALVVRIAADLEVWMGDGVAVSRYELVDWLLHYAKQLARDLPSSLTIPEDGGMSP